MWYSESCMDEDTFERILEYADLDSDEQEAFEAFLDVTCDKNVSFDDFPMGKTGCASTMLK